MSRAYSILFIAALSFCFTAVREVGAAKTIRVISPPAGETGATSGAVVCSWEATGCDPGDCVVVSVKEDQSGRVVSRLCVPFNWPTLTGRRGYVTLPQEVLPSGRRWNSGPTTPYRIAGVERLHKTVDPDADCTVSIDIGPQKALAFRPDRHGAMGGRAFGSQIRPVNTEAGPRFVHYARYSDNGGALHTVRTWHDFATSGEIFFAHDIPDADGARASSEHILPSGEAFLVIRTKDHQSLASFVPAVGCELDAEIQRLGIPDRITRPVVSKNEMWDLHDAALSIPAVSRRGLVKPLMSQLWVCYFCDGRFHTDVCDKFGTTPTMLLPIESIGRKLVYISEGEVGVLEFDSMGRGTSRPLVGLSKNAKARSVTKDGYPSLDYEIPLILAQNGPRILVTNCWDRLTYFEHSVPEGRHELPPEFVGNFRPSEYRQEAWAISADGRRVAWFEAGIRRVSVFDTQTKAINSMFIPPLNPYQMYHHRSEGVIGPPGYALAFSNEGETLHLVVSNDGYAIEASGDVDGLEIHRKVVSEESLLINFAFPIDK